MAKETLRITGKIKELLSLEKLVKDKVAAFSEEVSEELRSEVKRQIIETNTVASGDLFRSISSQVLIGPKSYNVEVGSTKRYAKQANEGRPPGRRPSPVKILKWMKDKGVDNPTKIKATFIADKIEKEGYEGKHFFDRAVSIVEGKIESIAERLFK